MKSAPTGSFIWPEFTKDYVTAAGGFAAAVMVIVAGHQTCQTE